VFGQKWVLPVILIICFASFANCTIPSHPTGTLPESTTPTNEPTPLTGQEPALTFVPVVPGPTDVVTTHPPYPAGTFPAFTPAVTPYATREYIPVRSTSYLPYGAGFPLYRSNITEPSDPSAITFLYYADPFFSIEYPSTWNVTKQGFVLFRSGSGRAVLAAEVTNFLPGFSGDYHLNTEISAVQDLVSREFPAYDSRNIIYDYKNTNVNGIPAAIYSVRLPDGSVAYQRYIFVTLQHTYRFTFAADATTFDALARVREYQFSTLRLNDQA